MPVLRRLELPPLASEESAPLVSFTNSAAAIDNNDDNNDDDVVGTVHTISTAHQQQQLSADSTSCTRKQRRTFVVVVVGMICFYIGVVKIPTKDESHYPYRPGSSDMPIYVEEINPGVGPIGPIAVQKRSYAPPPATFLSSSTTTKSQSISVSETMQSPRDAQTMWNNVQQFRLQLEQQLRQQYSSYYYDQIFLEQSHHNQQPNTYHRGRTIFQPASVQGRSWDRMKRKLQIKLLQVLIKSNNNNNNDDRIPFVWVIGGDSNAAGYGNLPGETIWDYMINATSEIWMAVGMRLELRNYAMHEISSAPQIALCLEQIFGKDSIDVLVWDYDQVDQSHAVERMALYFYRAALFLHQDGPPIGIVNRIGRRYFVERKQILTELEVSGIALMYQSELVMDRVLQGIPDSLGLTLFQRRQIPEYLRDFRCGNTVEGGHEQCLDEKFNLTICKDRPGRKSWYAGWKSNAIHGYLTAFFLLEVLDEALQEILQSDQNPSVLYASLQNLENTDLERLQKYEMYNYFENMIDEVDRAGLDIALHAKTRSLCHTAQLPAAIRYKGILTEHSESSVMSFDYGITEEEANSIVDNRHMRLVHSNASDDNYSTCKATLRLDHNDYFYTRTGDWNSIVLPNDTELNEYHSEVPFQGILAICFAACQYNHCPRRNMDREAFDENLFEMTVNKVPVSKMVKFGDCELLQNHANGYFWKMNTEGKFDFRAKVLQPDSALRIASFIIM